jgi:hypothetical protein
LLGNAKRGRKGWLRKRDISKGWVGKGESRRKAGARKGEIRRKG